MNYKLLIRKQAIEDINWFRKKDKQSHTKCFDLLLSIAENPREGIGHPERLKHYEEEVYSRQINKKDRIIYLIEEEEKLVSITYCRGHYGDK